MERQPQFTLKYLLLVVFWWALALAMMRGVMVYGGDEMRGLICFLSSPIAMGGAYGGLVLKMRFGLSAGSMISALLLVFAWLGRKE